VTVANDLLLDFESAESHVIVVEATLDGVTSEQSFTINVEDDTAEYFQLVNLGIDANDVATFAIYGHPEFDNPNNPAGYQDYNTGLVGYEFNLTFDEATMSFVSGSAELYGSPAISNQFNAVLLPNTTNTLQLTGADFAAFTPPAPFMADGPTGLVPDWFNLGTFKMNILDTTADLGFRAEIPSLSGIDQLTTASFTDGETDIISPITVGVQVSGGLTLPVDGDGNPLISMDGMSVYAASQTSTSGLYLKAVSLGATSTFELVADFDASVSDLDLTVNSAAGTTNVVDQAVTSGTDKVLGTFDVVAGSEIVISGISMDGVSSSDISLSVTKYDLNADGSYSLMVDKGSDVQVALDGLPSFTAVENVSVTPKPVTWQDALTTLKLGFFDQSITPTLENLIASDVNNDGSVTWQDALAMLKFAFLDENAIDMEYRAIPTNLDGLSLNPKDLPSTILTLNDLQTDHTAGFDIILTGDII